jgi:cytoskeleton protein RodZ
MAKVTRLTLDQGGLERRRLHLREISDDSDAPLETVGQDLRKARQRKGEDLAQVASVLKIRKDHLDALEESNFDALPGRPYAIGFARAYAEYLGLNSAECIERLKAEIAGRVEAKETSVSLTPREHKWPPGSVVFIVLLLVALVYGGYYLVSAAGRMVTQPVTPVPARLAEQAGLGVAQKAAPPVAAAPAAMPVTPPVTASAPTAAPPAASPVAQTPPAPAPAAVPPAVAARPAAPAAAPANPPSPAAVASLPAGRKFGGQNANSRISLRIHRSTVVTVQLPNGPVFLRRALMPGDVYQAPNTVGMTISTPDAGAVEVILDGTSLGFVGKDGANIEGQSLNPQDLVDRQGRG